MERTAPWKLAKEDPENRLGTVLHSVVELLRIATGLLAPVMPGKMRTIRTALGIAGGPADSAPLDEWGTSAAGAKIKDAGPVFPRIDAKKPADSAEPPKQKEKKKMEKSGKEETGLISIDEFFKAKLKTAKVLEAEKVEGADRLLKLKIDLGDERRQIVAGIAQFRSPEEMTGKTIVVVSNLKPAKIRGIESNGMLLAAKRPDGELAIVTLDDDTPPGCSVG
jgi:methionyl-tRNA synthetase